MHINKTIKKLEILQKLPKDDFFRDFQAIDSTKYNLQIAIEAIIDIATHIVAREKLGVPNSSAEAVRLLNEHGLLDQAETVKVIQMVKFRNRIVHLYQEIDDEQIYQILQSNINDITQFVEKINRTY